ncbi:MAG: glycine cleavage system aminomethyltransferase GcvT [Eubacteriales bacterium]
MYKKTSLYSKHIALSGKMVEFAGYEMPIQYSSIIKEHNMVREKCGLFDVSHMGILQIVGEEAEKLLQYICTIDIGKMQIGEAKYSLMCYENGGCVDDILVYKAPIGFLMVVNASNVSKDLEWINQNNNFDAQVINVSPAYSQIAIQGPLSEEILAKVININYIPWKNYTFKQMLEQNNRRVIISRTGYTGEDGFEIYMENDMAVKMWEDLLAAGGDDILPCGLGARDTLRLEAGMPLYGHELSADITPIEAGLKKFVAVNKESDFIGKETLKKQNELGVCRQRCFIELEGKGIAREGDLVFINDMRVGYLTSGNRSITLGKSVGIAMVRHPHNELGTKVQIQIRNKMVDAVVVKGPFYRRKK